jgi:hypothetical protein
MTLAIGAIVLGVAGIGVAVIVFRRMIKNK